jgi:hypothetical protein
VLPRKVHDAPTIVALLHMLEGERSHLRPPEPTA